MDLLVICEILEPFVNTYTTHDKYSLRNNDKLLQTSQMKLSKKQKTFTQFFVKLLKLTSNIEHFEEKYRSWPSQLMDSEITDCKRPA